MTTEGSRTDDASRNVCGSLRAELRRRWRTMKGTQRSCWRLRSRASCCFRSRSAGCSGHISPAGSLPEARPTHSSNGRVAFVYGWIFVVGFGGYRAYAVALRPDNLDGLLTAVSHRDLISGLLLTELALWSAFFLTVGSAHGRSRSPSVPAHYSRSPPCCSHCVSYLRPGSAGFIIALRVRNAGVRSRLLSRLRTLFLVLLGIGYFALIFTNAFASALEPIYQVLSPTPIDWFGDLAALGLGVGASPFRAIGAVGFTGVFVVVAVVSLYRLSDFQGGSGTLMAFTSLTRSSDRTIRSSRFNGLSRILSQPVFGVVVADWKRARRSPISLSFALYPLIVLAGPIVTAVQTGRIGTGLPLWVLLTGTWVAGSLFALNVVGQGAALPVTLLSGPRGAHWSPDTSSLVPSGSPITVAATVTAGILSPHSVPVVASLGGISARLVSPAVSGAIGTGIGVGLPRFGLSASLEITKAIVPSAFAFAIYSVAVLIVALPAVIAHSGIAGHALASAVGVNRFVIGLSGTLVSAVFACLVGIVSMYVARDRVRNYRLG